MRKKKNLDVTQETKKKKSCYGRCWHKTLGISARLEDLQGERIPSWTSKNMQEKNFLYALLQFFSLENGAAQFRKLYVICNLIINM